MRYFLSVFTLLIGVYYGVHTAKTSFEGTYFVSNSKYLSLRNPANVHKLSAYSELKGNVSELLSKDRLLAEAYPIKEDDKTAFIFGHFITEDQQGKKFFACDYYNKVQLNFVAEGIMDGGEYVKMKVEAPCHATADLNYLEPIWISQKEILAQTPSPNLKLDFASSDVHVSFSNLPSEWPRQWNLSEVKLLQEGSSISSTMRVSAKRPMTLNW